MPLKKEAIIIIAATLILYVLVLIFFLLTPFSDGYDFVIRFGALFGFTSMFIATMMTPFAVELYKIFGKPFIKIHHIYSIAGLILISLHPISFAINVMDITVFVPVFDTWLAFWQFAGRLAIYLIYVAILGALIRKKFKKNWRILHALNYVALFLAYVHGVLIGTDFQNLGILIIFTAMIVLSFGVLIFKRYQIFKRKKK